MPYQPIDYPLPELLREFSYDPLTGKLTRKYNQFYTAQGDVYIDTTGSGPRVLYLSKQMSAVSLCATLHLKRHVTRNEVIYTPAHAGDLRWSAFLIIPPDQKYCKTCKMLKPNTEFVSKTAGNPKKGNQCKPCKNKYASTYYKAVLPLKYGLTKEQHAQMLADQNHECKICRKPAAQNKHGVLCVDHCHATGEVRGLLCNACNTALGLMKDDAARLLGAAKYLLGK